MKDFLKKTYQSILFEKKVDTEKLQRRIDNKDMTTNIPCYLGVYSANNLPYLSIEISQEQIKKLKEEKTVGIETKFIKINNQHFFHINLLEKIYINNYFYLLSDLIEIFTLNLSEDAELIRFKKKLDSWITFFKKNKNKRLSKEEVIGLFGELIFLEKILDFTEDNDFIWSWKGPFGDSQDFIRNNKYIEIKTSTSQSNKNVHISSEFQLDSEGKDFLYLANILIEESESGRSLKQIIGDVKKRLNSEQQNFFKDLLAAIKVDEKKLSEYKEKYSLKKINIYEIKDEFPVIANSQIDGALSNIEYEVDLGLQDEYFINLTQALKDFTK